MHRTDPLHIYVTVVQLPVGYLTAGAGTCLPLGPFLPSGLPSLTTIEYVPILLVMPRPIDSHGRPPPFYNGGWGEELRGGRETVVRM